MKLNRRLLVHVARVLVPAEPRLGEADRAQVEADVVDYLTGQILAMPVYLRVPYALALHAFNCSSLLRFGLPFTRVQPARQSRFVRLWSQSPVGLMRDFIKLIRSCVLLAYFDHRLVLERLEDEARSAAVPS